MVPYGEIIWNIALLSYMPTKHNTCQIGMEPGFYPLVRVGKTEKPPKQLTLLLTKRLLIGLDL